VTSDLCAAFQDVAFTHVEDRLSRALDFVEDSGVAVTALVVVGGVAANKELRRRLLELLESRRIQGDIAPPLVFPPPNLCTDNGVMAAWGGVEKLALGISDAIEGQEVQARWPLATAFGPGELIFRKSPNRKERDRIAWEGKKLQQQSQEKGDSL
jgi:N6-L-threonylcarbamoyladenine synthase